MQERFSSNQRRKRTSHHGQNSAVEGSVRFVQSNGLPGHEIGDFPNRHDPIAVKSQSHQLRMPVQPVRSDKPIPINMWWFGVDVNGVPFDPSGPFWDGDVSSGWQFEVLHPAQFDRIRNRSKQCPYTSRRDVSLSRSTRRSHCPTDESRSLAQNAIIGIRRGRLSHLRSRVSWECR